MTAMTGFLRAGHFPTLLAALLFAISIPVLGQTRPVSIVVPVGPGGGTDLLAREIAKTDAYWTSMRQRKKVEMLFAHLKRILKLDRLRLRGPCGARDEFLLAATAQNLRKLAKLIPAPAPLAPA